MSEELGQAISSFLNSFLNSPLEDLEVEYTRLFINSYPSLPCPPYESVYRTEEGLVMDEKVISSLMEIYELAGLRIDRSKVDLPEHAAAELELLSYLIERSLSGDTVMKSAAKRLIDEHLSLWLLDLGDCIEREARGKAYRELGELLKILSNIMLSTREGGVL